MAASVSIVRIGTVLVVSLQNELDDETAEAMERRIATETARIGATGLILDVACLEIIDSFVARIFDRIAGVARLLGVETVIVGVRTAVAITLVELGLTLTKVSTALDVERGLALLKSHDGKTPTA